MFSSVDHGDFEGAIEYGECRLHGEECYGCVYAEPDREIPYQPHNPANPILVAFRGKHAVMLSARDNILDALAAVRIGSTPYMQSIIDRDGINARVTREHITHARAVLTRLANLTEETA